jgi:NarL family two-component system sensor histidine kinase YdfH
MRNLFRQTNDPEVEVGIKETQPFFWFLIIVLIILYGITITSSPELRQPARFIPYTILFFLHIVLHWYMPYILVTRRQLLPAYLVVQIILVFLLILIGQQPSLVLGLYLALAGEMIGVLDNWRWALALIPTFLLLIGLTYGLIWGWQDAPGWLAGALVMMLFVLIYVLMFMRQFNARMESQRLLEELQEAHAQLAEYSQQVETLTLEAERQRMARELHDTLAQGLAGLVLQLEALEVSLERDNTQQALQITAQAKERARTTLAEARSAIDDLRTTEASTAETIGREVEHFTAATGIPCSLEMPPALNLSEQNGEHSVRCVSEGLANVTRHARATQVWVSIEEEDGRVEVQIRDNGRGFDTDSIVETGHYGLLGLRERARLADGELTIESELGAGTTLCMTLPAEGENGESI